MSCPPKACPRPYQSPETWPGQDLRAQTRVGGQCPGRQPLLLQTQPATRWPWPSTEFREGSHPSPPQLHECTQTRRAHTHTHRNTQGPLGNHGPEGLCSTQDQWGLEPRPPLISQIRTCQAQTVGQRWSWHCPHTQPHPLPTPTAQEADYSAFPTTGDPNTGALPLTGRPKGKRALDPRVAPQPPSLAGRN